MNASRLCIFIFFITKVIYSFSQNEECLPLCKIDFNWQFHLGDVTDGANPDLNTDDWRILDLPHDWSIPYRMKLRPDIRRRLLYLIKVTATGRSGFNPYFLTGTDIRFQPRPVK